MKRLLLAVLVFVLIISPYAFAGMGGSGGGMMEGKQGHMGKSGMMLRGHEMMGGMMQDMKQMTGMMQKMTDIMGKTTDMAHMKTMSVIMKEMSGQMGEMSGLMSKGEASQKEMQKLHQQMSETQKRFDMMQMW